MARKISEKLLSADVSAEVQELFLAQAEERVLGGKKRALQAAAQLWCSLSEEAQRAIIKGVFPLEKVAFLMDEILVQNVAQATVATGKHKPDRRGSKAG